MDRPSRCLEYAGVDAAWEARERRAFSHRNAGRSPHTVRNYLLGRLLEEDLHVSCRPMLPANIQEMNGTMLQGVCLLQIVDIVNIGASFQHRTEESSGPTRTLKLCLTDGHQTVFAFEYKWIPALTVKTPRGTKVLVKDVGIRHGVMMLTPETCQIVGASGNDALDAAKLQISSSTGTAAIAAPSGAYSAALMTAGANFVSSKSTNEKERASPAPRPAQGTTHPTTRVTPPTSTSIPPRANHSLPRTAAELIGAQFGAPSSAAPATTPSNPPSRSATPPRPRPAAFSPPRIKPRAATTAVFVDISSEDEDMASDVTDPMVEHLFYSPNTPRLKDDIRAQPSASRKRPHPESSRSRAVGSSAPSPQPEVVDMTASPPLPTRKRHESEPSVSILPTNSTPSPAARVDLKLPFVYLNSQSSALTESDTQVGSILTIRGFMKSVTGFQFNTGTYNLRALVEDGTGTKDVRVEPALVERLMGVSCYEFARAMQATPRVAHQLAAKMQVTLMTMQGIMRLRLDTTSPDTWTLLQCREYSASETHALLARVRHFATEHRR